MLWWVLVATLVAIAVGYSVYRRSEVAYWDGAVGNWIATLLGIVTGVPVALAIERRRVHAEQDAHQKSRQSAARNVLILLRQELVNGKGKVGERVALFQSVPVEPLVTSAWDAMRAAGTLHHVAAPYLIGPIAEAYRSIQVLAEIESTLLSVVYGVNVQFPDGENAATKIMRNAIAFHSPALAAIDTAIAVIDKELESLPAGEGP